MVGVTAFAKVVPPRGVAFAHPRRFMQLRPKFLHLDDRFVVADKNLVYAFSRYPPETT